MKAVILAGGYGSRMSEDAAPRPKAMVEVGGQPLLWHLMKIYAGHGIREFIICCGLNGAMIKRYFATYYLHTNDLRFDLAKGRMEVLHRQTEPWKVTVLETGDHTATGGRLLRIRDHLDDTFCFSYGDTLTDANLGDLIRFHEEEGTLVSMLSVRPPARFAAVQADGAGKRIHRVTRRGQGQLPLANGGFFVASPRALDYVRQPSEFWINEPMARLGEENQVALFQHHGFWRCLDHLSDKLVLEDLWASGNPPWKIWD